jgi:hypothetical protein
MVKKLLLSIFFISSLFFSNLNAQESISKLWTEHVLFAVRNDFARPTMHARNLFHSSIVMYDAWAAYESDVDFYLLGKTHAGLYIPFEGVVIPLDTLTAQQEAISFAMYRLMLHRYGNSPGAGNAIPRINNFMDSLMYDRTNVSIDYINGGPAELGNYIAAKMIQYAYLDGSNEIGAYNNLYYTPVQGPVEPEFPGNPSMIDPNRWQAIALSYAVDQAGNVLTANPPFLSPEWGNVEPFAIPSNAQTTYSRNGNNYIVHHDPGPPAYLDTTIQTQLDSYYKWNFSLVSVWQSHLDPADTTVWDISPASIGNIQNYPTQYSDYPSFYNYFEGGDPGTGYALNPITNLPYTPQLVKRADYARVLAEFWADGLDSETPPGHWFNIYNEISTHPLYEKKWKGVGPILDDLEYDVKLYLTLGGAMHDAAISAWSIKGWYDYTRPVSAIRYMAGKGQSTSNMLPNFHNAGIPLVPGYIEQVELGDPLAGVGNQNIGKIKLYTWKGPDYIVDPQTTYAGVDWILAEEWWPYQRPSFVTPPFAGYVSGHSTFSRAAAEVLTFITGSSYFPGGMSGFTALENDFLEFEDGPSTDVILAWATYRDASDQCSLSRIWGGIHPPTDDMNGRLIGEMVGLDASDKADLIFQKINPTIDSIISAIPKVNIQSVGQTLKLTAYFNEVMDISFIPQVNFVGDNNPLMNSLTSLGGVWLNNQVYERTYQINALPETMRQVLVQVDSAVNLAGVYQNPHIALNPFSIDKERPNIQTITPSATLVNDSIANLTIFYIDLAYDEACDLNSTPVVSFSNPGIVNNVLSLNSFQSSWINSNTFRVVYNVVDTDLEGLNISLQVDAAKDEFLNLQNSYNSTPVFNINTQNPSLLSYTISDTVLSRVDIGSNVLVCTFEFNQALQTSNLPTQIFSNSTAIGASLQFNTQNSFWIDSFNLQLTYNLLNQSYESGLMDITLDQIKDSNGNSAENGLIQNAVTIDTKIPELLSASPSVLIVSDNESSSNGFVFSLHFSEKMDQQQKPIAELFLNGSLNTEINYNVFGSNWISDSIFEAKYNVIDNNIELDSFELKVNFGKDEALNPQNLWTQVDWIDLDTKNPTVISLTASTYLVTNQTSELKFTAVFDEPMEPNSILEMEFLNASGIENVFLPNLSASQWLNSLTYELVYDVQQVPFNEDFIAVKPKNARDFALNLMAESALDSFLSVQIEPTVIRDVNMELNTYPNPVRAGAQLFVQLENECHLNRVILINELGMTCHEYSLDQFNQHLVNIKIPENLNGLYWLRMETDQNVFLAKILITQ